MKAADVIATLQQRGVTFRLEGARVQVTGSSKLTNQEKATLKAHKAALLEALRQSAETVNDQGETVSRAPWVQADPEAMATGVRHGLYAPNCNRCRRYNWRSEICQRQGRLEFANTPPCQGRYYQPFALTLAEREAMAGATGENVS